MKKWEEACSEIDCGGIYDSFRDAPDAIRQLGFYIKEAEGEIPHPRYGVPLWAEIRKLVDTLKEIRDQDPVENALDPQWAARLAKEALGS